MVKRRSVAITIGRGFEFAIWEYPNSEHSPQLGIGLSNDPNLTGYTLCQATKADFDRLISYLERLKIHAE